MISLASSLPPIPSVSEFEQSKFVQLMDLISLVTDPEKAQKHLGDIFEARMAWSEAKTDAEKILKELDAKRTEHNAQVKIERDEHDRSIAVAKAKFDSDCSAGMAEVRSQQERVAKLKARAEADAEAAAALRSDLDQRLAKIKAAAE